MIFVLIIIQFLVGAALCLFLSFQRGGRGRGRGEGAGGRGEWGEGRRGGRGEGEGRKPAGQKPFAGASIHLHFMAINSNPVLLLLYST
jgi:hypothetical protein